MLRPIRVLQMLLPRRKFSALAAIWFCLAVVTACGRRVDSRDRQAPSTHAADDHQPRDPKLVRPTVAVGRAKPEIRHVDAEELFGLVRSWKLKGIVLNIWATWCGPCQEELPVLAKVGNLYRSRGIAVIPWSVDDPADEAKIPQLLGDAGFAPPYYVVRGSIDTMKVALYPAWPGNIPVSFILDGSAERRYFFNAEVYEQELVPKIDALLEGTLGGGKSNFGVAPGKEF